MSQFSVYNNSGVLVGSDEARSLRFSGKYNIDIHCTNEAGEYNSDIIDMGFASKIIAVQSPHPIGLGYGGGWVAGGGPYDFTQGLRFYAWGRNPAPGSFGATFYTFDPPTAPSGAGGPRLVVYDTAGQVTFNSADIKLKIASVIESPMNYGTALSANPNNWGILQEIATGLPAGNYAVQTSPPINYISWARNTGTGITITTRHVMVACISGGTLQIGTALDYRALTPGIGGQALPYDTETRTLISTIFDVSGL